MKKIFIMILFLTLISTTANSFIVIGKSGGGPNGYSTVIEKHEGDDHTLICQNQGYEKCDWMHKPQITGPNSIAPWEDLEQYANDQVKSGNLVGSYTNNVTINGDLWNRSVQWDGQDTLNIEIDINIQLVTYPN